MEWWSLERVVYGTDYKKDQGNGEEDEEDKTINLVLPIRTILRVSREISHLLGRNAGKGEGRTSPSI